MGHPELTEGVLVRETGAGLGKIGGARVGMLCPYLQVSLVCRAPECGNSKGKIGCGLFGRASWIFF